MMNNVMAQEIHETDNHETTWFSTSTNALLNRSSTALATQHISRGLRLAHQAMQQELVLSDQLIANHNLCVGYLSTGETATAKLYCAQTKELALQALNIIKVRGAYFLTEKAMVSDVQISSSLFHVVLNNIECQTWSAMYRYHHHFSTSCLITLSVRIQIHSYPWL
jgi:hypothetical protein